ncbi:rho guanine nucleotide exchange factor 11-like isoform X9 [Ptychodera flava]|uniref:rho guanine nucleotide exchange factor 11-like isoform X9 n=1 Tax=Ptychodera flava TaxID=63121 RepID=UPI00396A1252
MWVFAVVILYLIYKWLVSLSQDSSGEKKQMEKDKEKAPPSEKELPRRPSSTVMETVQDPYGAHLIQRCVIVQRDEKGYGLTVSGDNPVYVQSVKEYGAAHKAGVQQGDRIIKVNGTLVTQSNHIEVVKLIKSGSYVALTLLGRPPGSNQPPLPRPHVPLNPNQLYTSGRPEVTGPKPAGPEKDEELRKERISVMQKMLDQEMDLYQKTQGEFSKNPSEKLKKELEGATIRVKVLEQQLHNLTGLSMAAKNVTSSVSDYSEDFEENLEEDPPPPLPSEPPPPQPIVGHSPVEIDYSEDHYSSPMTTPESSFTEGSGGTYQGYESSPEMLRNTAMTVLEEDDHIAPTGVPTSAPESTASVSESDTEAWNKNIELKYRPAPWLQQGAHHTRQHSSPETFYLSESDLPGCGSGVTVKRNLSDAADKKLKRPHISATDSDHKLSSENVSYPGDPNTSNTDTLVMDSDGDQDSERHAFIPMEQQEVNSFGNEEQQDTDYARQEQFTIVEVSPSEEARSHDYPDSAGPVLQTATVNTVEAVSHSEEICATPIISMEDEDFADEAEMSQDHGPFNSLEDLEKKPAHMAVFLHYLISNHDPSAVFFYLVTDSYSTGNLKEMKKWAYEIFSTFLAPSAPLRIEVDESIIQTIDDTISSKNDNIELMRNVFMQPRKIAAEESRELLADYRSKRSMGLGNFYGEMLLEDYLDKSKEAQIVESTLMPHLDRMTGVEAEIDNKNLALASSLTTFMKQSGVKVQGNSPLERLPSFTAKDKQKFKLKNKKAIQVKGHHFILFHYQTLPYCNYCGELVWGIGNQGYQCQSCEYNVHKTLCVEKVQEHCKGKKKKDKGSRIRQIIPRRISENNPKASMYSPPPYGNTVKEAQKIKDEKDRERLFSFPTPLTPSTPHPVDQPLPQHASVTPPGVGTSHISPQIQSMHDKEDDDLAHLRGSNKVGKIVEEMEELQEIKEIPSPVTPRSESPEVLADGERQEKSNKVVRSGSLRTHEDLRRKSQTQEKRSKSHLRHTRSVDDVDVDQAAVTTFSNANSRGSSSSSISTKSQESPSTSVSMETVSQMRVIEHDSDMEAEQDTPNWQNTIDKDILKSLKPKEIKRQEVINELFHTEKTHVRNLKILDRIFMKPMRQEQLLTPEMIRLLFPSLEDLLEMHTSLNVRMKKERKTSHVIDSVGDILLARFDGQPGEDLKEACANFCRYQSFALDKLKHWQKKDDKLAKFLADAENNPVCRRLQLKDFIPCVFQRLTKYPLLLDNIIKYTQNKSPDHEKVTQARNCCKNILEHVNTAVREAENQLRLQDLIKKTDRTPFDKSSHTFVSEFKNIDLMARKLIHDGPLTWRQGRAKSVDLHVLLLEDLLVLLQKDDNRYILKCHSTTTQTGQEQVKNTHSPIIKLTNLLCRNVATDKKAFFLVSTSQVGPQIYELVASTGNERKIWSDKITQQADGVNKLSNKRRGGKVVTSPSHLPPPPDFNEADEEKIKPSLLANIVSDTEKFNVKNKSGSLDNLDHIGYEHKVNPVEIQNPPRLINPDDVVVTNHQVKFEKPDALTMLSPIQRLRKIDETLHNALIEKNRIISEILGLPMEEYDDSEQLSQYEDEVHDPKRIVHDVMLQSNRLLTATNDHMTSISHDQHLGSTDTSNEQAGGDWKHSTSLSYTQKISSISRCMNDHLTRLLGVITMEEHGNQATTPVVEAETEGNLEQQATENQDSGDLKEITEDVKELTISDSEQSPPQVIRRSRSASPNSQTGGSRPNSFISVGSSSAAEGQDPEEIEEELYQHESSSEMSDVLI